MPKGILFLLLCSHIYAWSQPESSESSSSYVREVTSKLCSAEFHGRGYVKKGDSIAASFLAAEFQKIGLKPLKRSYFQRFEHTVNTFPSNMLLISGNDTLIPGQDFIVDPACPEVKLILRFRVISCAEALSKEGLQIAIQEVVSGGKYNAFLLDQRSCSADTLKVLRSMEKALTNYAHTVVRTNEKLTWSVASNQLRYPLIFVNGTFPLAEELHIDISAKMQKSYTSYNVIGYMPAHRRTKRTIILCAHYDHLGMMGSQTYFPGANDNASGTATLLGVAKNLDKATRKVNYLFIAFAGEEAGLVGSKYYTEHPVFPLKNIRFLLNLDIMGSGEDGITVVNATAHPAEFELLQKLNTEGQLLRQVKSRGPAANSDHYWFSERGVPAFFIYTMGLNKNYHDIKDTYENLSFAETNDLIHLITSFLSQVAL